ncbi:hypothetical protein UNDKW_2913 [Undibacterium sp. KW1]|uniref:hypothetical protein n=1 Tax=Undibacterium sp. KW1 TaxID=2058624 RepID=UPI001331E96B|nr:hypothetical protein [Undibacterium sp. KW1]BBB61186.1 hypothetical protein UNDKW_2913 [Undibacterium sp. KW1]
MHVAFYRGTRPGFSGIYNRLVRWWTKGPYSHCELVFDDCMCASSSFMDGGVRLKYIEFDSQRWDFVNVPDSLAPGALRWFREHLGAKYDLKGNFHFLVSAVGDDNGKWFCNEAVGAALGINQPWRFDPNSFYALLTSGLINERKDCECLQTMTTGF